MRAKTAERAQAIALRKRGLSYADIQARVPVSSASLSLWLRGLPLDEEQRRRLNALRRRGPEAGGRTNHVKYLTRVSKVRAAGNSEARRWLRDGEIRWAVGTALYWAEGSKPKEWNPWERVSFTSMDPAMLLSFRRWILFYGGVRRDDLTYDLYIHATGDLDEAKRFWASALEISADELRVYFKPHNPSPHRNNTGSNHRGTIRIRVRASSDLNQRIAAWIGSLAEFCGVG